MKQICDYQLLVSIPLLFTLRIHKRPYWQRKRHDHAVWPSLNCIWTNIKMENYVWKLVWKKCISQNFYAYIFTQNCLNSCMLKNFNAIFDNVILRLQVIFTLLQHSVDPKYLGKWLRLVTWQTACHPGYCSSAGWSCGWPVAAVNIALHAGQL